MGPLSRRRRPGSRSRPRPPRTLAPPSGVGAPSTPRPSTPRPRRRLGTPRGDDFFFFVRGRVLRRGFEPRVRRRGDAPVAARPPVAPCVRVRVRRADRERGAGLPRPGRRRGPRLDVRPPRLPRGRGHGDGRREEVRPRVDARTGRARAAQRQPRGARAARGAFRERRARGGDDDFAARGGGLGLRRGLGARESGRVARTGHHSGHHPGPARRTRPRTQTTRRSCATSSARCARARTGRRAARRGARAVRRRSATRSSATGPRAGSAAGSAAGSGTPG